MAKGIDEGKRRTLRRFAALGTAGSLTGLAGRTAADERGGELSRDAITGYVLATPGVHFSKLRDDLRLGTGETQHHLRRLERDGAIVSRRDGDYRRFYPAGRFSDLEQVALGYLRRPTPRGIVLALLEDPTSTGGAIADGLGVSAATVSAAAAELERAELLDRGGGYQLRHRSTLLVLVLRYAESFGSDAVGFADRADEVVSVDQ